MKTTALLVLAAGMGSRYGGIKQIDPVGSHGETTLEYSLYDAREAGFDRVVFLLRREIEEEFRASVLSRLPAELKTSLAFQDIDSLLTTQEAAEARAAGRSKPWGTGHALLCAARAFDCPFAVVNADDFYGRESFRLVHDRLASSDPEGSDWCMAGFALRNTTSPHGYVSRGLCDLDLSGRLVSVTEHVRISQEGARFASALEDGSIAILSGDEIVSMNLWGFTPKVSALGAPLFRSFIGSNAASAKAEFGLPDIVRALVSSGSASVTVLPTPEAWFGLTWREDAPAARARMADLVAAGLYPEPLWGAP